MRSRTIAGGTLLVLALLVLAIAMAVRSYCPLNIIYAGKEPSGITDDSGRVSWLLTFVISNRTASAVYFPRREWLQVEAELGGAWVKTEQIGSLSAIYPRGGTRVLALVPNGSQRCRVHVEYAPPSLRQRLEDQLIRWRVRLPMKYVYNPNPPAGLNPSWASRTLEFPLPKESEEAAHASEPD